MPSSWSGHNPWSPGNIPKRGRGLGSLFSLTKRRHHLLSCPVHGAAQAGQGRKTPPAAVPPPPASTRPPPVRAGPKERGQATYPAPGTAATSRLSRNHIV